MRSISHRAILLSAGVFFFVFLLSKSLQGQDQDIGISFSGFVKADYFFDSRQTVAVREGHFLLFPSAENPGPDGVDINASPSLNMLAVQTRLRASISGPDFFNMQTSGIIEGAFFGHSNGDINGFRLRHAFLKLSGEKVNIYMGQYWHPMFVTACFPGVYSFNTGVPFQPFSRNPQLRVETKGNLRILAAIVSQRDFASRGPDGTSSKYLRNAVIPNIHIQLQYARNGFHSGLGVDFKRLKPSLTDAVGNRSDETVDGFSFLGFAKYQKDNFTIKWEAVYGQNLADHLMLGGIAEVKPFEYTTYKVFASWLELSGSSENREWGLFMGYTANLGLCDMLGGESYALGGNIDHVYRIAPRFAFISGKMKLGGELEFTSAQYGQMEAGTDVLITEGIDPVWNVRLLVFGLYSF